MKENLGASRGNRGQAVQDLLPGEDQSADRKQTEDRVGDPKAEVHLFQELGRVDGLTTIGPRIQEAKLDDPPTKTAVLQAVLKGQTPNSGTAKQRINSKTKEIGRLVGR